jgi:hypothetical protein
MDPLKSGMQTSEGKAGVAVGLIISLYTALKAFGVLNWTPEQEQSVLHLLYVLAGLCAVYIAARSHIKGKAVSSKVADTIVSTTTTNEGDK